MQYKKEKKITGISLILLLLIVFSCKENTTEKIKKNSKMEETKTTAFVKFNFPDTVFRNEMYKGEISYKGVLDTITTNVLKKTNGVNRYIIYSLTKTKNIDYNTKQLYKIKLDTFGAVDNRTIPFYDIKFAEVGTFYIDGILNDYVTIEKPNAKPSDKSRYIENVLRATHKVIVIENPDPPTNK